MAISQHGTSVLFTSHPKDGLVVNLYIPKKLSVPFLYPEVPAGLTPFRGLVPLGRRKPGAYSTPGTPSGRAARIGYHGFLFPHSYSGDGLGAT